MGPNRWRFLIQTLKDLDQNLRKIGSRLFLIKGKPIETFEKLFKDWNVKKLTFEIDIEPYSKKRDEEVESLAEKHSVTVVKKVSNTIYDLEKYWSTASYDTLFITNSKPIIHHCRVFRANGNKAPLTYVKFQSVVNKLGAPEAPLDAPDTIPKPCQTSILTDFCVPALEELQVDLTGLGNELYRGGETEALARLEKYMCKQVFNISTVIRFLTKSVILIRSGYANSVNRTRPLTVSFRAPLY